MFSVQTEAATPNRTPLAIGPDIWVYPNEVVAQRHWTRRIASMSAQNQQSSPGRYQERDPRLDWE